MDASRTRLEVRRLVEEVGELAEAFLARWTPAAAPPEPIDARETTQ